MTTLDNFKTTPELTVLFTALEHYFAARDLATKARGLLHEATTGKPLALALSNADIPPQLRNAKPLDVLKWIFMAHFNMSPQVVETSSLDELTKQAISGAKDCAEMTTALLKKVEAAARSGAAHGAKSGVAKSLPPLMRELATAAPGDPDPLAPKKRAPGAGRPKQNDLDGKQVEDAYERIAGSPKAQSFTAICAQLIRNPPKGRKYQKPYSTAKALFNAVKRAHPDLSDLRP